MAKQKRVCTDWSDACDDPASSDLVDVSTSGSEKEMARNAEIVRTMPDNIAAALAKARTKPAWCSDIRWRMELGRRKYKYLY